MNWKCLHDKVIVRRRPAIEAIGAVAVPEAHRKAQNIGTVEVVGEGRLVAGSVIPVPLTVRVGMTVLFSAFSGVPLEGEDPDLILLREDELLAYED